MHLSGSHPLLFDHILWTGINIVPRELLYSKLLTLSTYFCGLVLCNVMLETLVCYVAAAFIVVTRFWSLEFCVQT